MRTGVIGMDDDFSMTADIPKGSNLRKKYYLNSICLST
jgi:hypothetical protein